MNEMSPGDAGQIDSLLVYDSILDIAVKDAAFDIKKSDAIGTDAGTPSSWVSAILGPGSPSGEVVATDKFGNVFVAGTFTGTVVVGKTTLSSNGSMDIFITKLNHTGTTVWTIQSGGPAKDVVTDIATDSAGNLIVAGTFEGPAKLGATTVYASFLHPTLFVAKLSPSGKFGWVAQAGNAGIGSVHCTPSGHVHVAGCFRNSTTLGSTTLSSKGSGDIFVAKLDTAGKWLRAVGAGGSGTDYGYRIGADKLGNRYVMGAFDGTVTFGSIILTGKKPATDFVAKLPPNSNAFDWALSIPGTDDPYYNFARGIAVDDSGTSYITGKFQYPVMFGGKTLIPKGKNDIYVASIDKNGKQKWSTSLGGNLDDMGMAITLGPLGDLYLTGVFAGTVSFGTKAGSLTAKGANDIFVARMDASGKVLGVLWASSPGYPMVKDIAVDGSRNVLTTGRFNKPTQFGSISVKGSGGWDGFVWKAAAGSL